MVKRLLLFAVCMMVFVVPAAAVNEVQNGGFETGDTTDWTTSLTTVTASAAHNGSYGARMYIYDGSGAADIDISQTVDLTGISGLDFYYKVPTLVPNGNVFYSDVVCYVGGTEEYRQTHTESQSTWAHVDINVSAYSGSKIIKLAIETGGVPGQYDIEMEAFFDDVVADDGTGLASDSVEWDTNPYYSGDTAYIMSNITNTSWDTGNYSYYINIYDTGGLKESQSITTQNSTKSYTFSPIQHSAGFLVRLKRQHTNNTVDILATDYTQFYETGTTYEVEFDQAKYQKDDLITVYYTDLPTGSTLYLNSDANAVYKTWTVSGSGSKTYQLDNAIPDSTFMLYGISGGYVLDTDSMTILEDPSWATVSGYAYDARTYSGLDGVLVEIGGSYNTTTNSIGWYSLAVPVGTENITATAAGYTLEHPEIYNNYIVSGDVTLNLYMFEPPASGSHILYGTVLDYDTTQPMGHVYVTATNSTTTLTAFTDADTGYYEIDGIENGESYIIAASHSGYINHHENITISSLPDEHSFSMIPDEYVPGGGDSEEETLDDNESMTEYFNEKFRGFAPTAWGLFMLMCILYLMSILTSFGGGGRRR